MNQDTSSLLTIKRTFAAPLNRIFDAWTNPNNPIGWWGPKDVTLLFDEKDLKPGGQCRMGMIRPCEKAVSGGVYREIALPARLVMTYGWEVDGQLLPPQTLVTVRLAERDDKTEMVYDDAATRDGHRAGWDEAFDALEKASAENKEAHHHDS